MRQELQIQNGPLGPDTDIINGQLVTVRNRSPYFPMGWAPVAQRVPQITATVPPMIGTAGGYQSSDTMLAAIHHPWSIFHSPLPWAIFFLVFGLLGLRFIHWRPIE